MANLTQPRLFGTLILVFLGVIVLLSASYTAVSPLDNSKPTPNYSFTIPDPDDSLICTPDDDDNILFPSCHANVLRDYLPPQDLQAMSSQPCVGGMAGIYPCDNIDLLSFLPLADIGGGGGNDIWGWTDPLDGKEYALMGRTNGTAFVDISDPYNPVYLGNLPTHSSNTTWRDIKVFNNHAFIVSEASNHGMQVFDLTHLRTVATPPVTFVADAHYSEFSRAHNIAINEESGFAYAVGTNTCSGGLHMININTPTSPTFAGCFSGDGYTHDTQCVIYDGPDVDYQGQEICFNSNEDTLTIVDVTDKSAPAQLSRTGYSGHGYTHQGWLTEDHHYFLLSDEIDEINNGHNTRTYVWDVNDLDNPFLIDYHDGRTAAIDHNLYTRGDKVYQANYRAGLNVLQIVDLDEAELLEYAYFDIYPLNDNTSFNGAWSNFPYFESNVIIVSGMEQGLFVLRLAEDAGDPTPTPTATATAMPTATATATATAMPTTTATATATTMPTIEPTSTNTPPITVQLMLPIILRQLPPTPTPTPTSTPIPTDTPVPTPSPTSAPPTVQILPNHSYFVDSVDYLNIVGEILNNTSNHLRFVRITANIFNNQGQLIDTNFTFTYLGNLPAYEKTCFHIVMPEPDGLAYYEFETPTYWTDGNPLSNLTVFNHSGSYAPTFGWYEVIGQVRNDHGSYVEYVQPIGTLYNAESTVIGCDFTFVNSTHLNPNQTSSFAMTFLGRDYADATSYRLQVDGQPDH